MIAQASPSFTVQPKWRSNGDLVWDGAPNAIQCTNFRPGRDMDYWLLISDLSCGIGTRARQRVVVYSIQRFQTYLPDNASGGNCDCVTSSLQTGHHSWDAHGPTPTPSEALREVSSTS